MGAKTGIEWTGATWTPIRARHRTTGKIGWHCVHASPGCKFCYSEGINHRLGTGLAFRPDQAADIEIFLDEQMLLAPLRWRRPRMIFVCSMTDLFADFVRDEWIDAVFAVMALCPQHTFQVLTKRSARMRRYCQQPSDGLFRAVDRLHPAHDGDGALVTLPAWPLPNVWKGGSVEDQPRADERIPHLLATPAAVRFLSCEPLLGPLRLASEPCEMEGVNWLEGYAGSDPPIPRIDWLICGGESGPHARPMHPDWARGLRDQCVAAGVPFFMKQMTKRAPIPDDLMIREMPEALARCP